MAGNLLTDTLRNDMGLDFIWRIFMSKIHNFQIGIEFDPCLRFPSLCVDIHHSNPFNPHNPHNPPNPSRRHNKERFFNRACASLNRLPPPPHPLFSIPIHPPRKQDDQRHLLDRIANDSGYAVVITFVRGSKM